MSNRLRIARHRLELKQPEFGELLGVGKSSIVRWETGKGPMPPVVAEKLSLIESALAADPEVGERMRAAWAGKRGVLKVTAAWAELVGGK